MANNVVTLEAHRQIRASGVKGGTVPATHHPQKPATCAVPIMDVNGIKSTIQVILNAVKREQRFELKATANTATVVSDHSVLLDMQSITHSITGNSSCTTRLPGVMYHVQFM